MKRLTILPLIAGVFAFVAPAAAGQGKPKCVVTRIELATDGKHRTVIDGVDQCTDSMGRWFAVEWFIDPRDASCVKDVGADGPGHLHKTYFAYIAYDACAAATQGHKPAWPDLQRALATESRVSTNLLTTYEP